MNYPRLSDQNYEDIVVSTRALTIQLFMQSIEFERRKMIIGEHFDKVDIRTGEISPIYLEKHSVALFKSLICNRNSLSFQIRVGKQCTEVRFASLDLLVP